MNVLESSLKLDAQEVVRMENTSMNQLAKIVMKNVEPALDLPQIV